MTFPPPVNLLLEAFRAMAKSKKATAASTRTARVAVPVTKSRGPAEEKRRRRKNKRQVKACRVRPSKLSTTCYLRRVKLMKSVNPLKRRCRVRKRRLRMRKTIKPGAKLRVKAPLSPPPQRRVTLSRPNRRSFLSQRGIQPIGTTSKQQGMTISSQPKGKNHHTCEYHVCSTSSILKPCRPLPLTV